MKSAYTEPISSGGIGGTLSSDAISGLASYYYYLWKIGLYQCKHKQIPSIKKLVKIGIFIYFSTKLLLVFMIQKFRLLS